MPDAGHCVSSNTTSRIITSRFRTAGIAAASVQSVLMRSGTCSKVVTSQIATAAATAPAVDRASRQSARADNLLMQVTYEGTVPYATWQPGHIVAQGIRRMLTDQG